MIPPIRGLLGIERCETQEAIAEAVGVPQQTVADWMKDFTEKCQENNPVNWHDFTPPMLSAFLR
jgi:hypothetical protein